MVDVPEDRETGEVFLDHETGEEVNCMLLPSPQQRARDAETGEPHVDQFTNKKRAFQIPKSALLPRPNSDLVLIKKMLPPAIANKNTHTNCLERKVECVSQNMSPILFLLPTLFLFPGWASVMLIVFELVSHTWAHKKNKLRSRDSNILYRSPLNLITSEFCAYCQADKLMLKIGKLQDERMLQVHSRKLSYCAYVEKMSVIT